MVPNDASAKQIIYMKYLSLIKRHNYETTCNDPPVFTWEHEKLVKFASWACSLFLSSETSSLLVSPLSPVLVDIVIVAIVTISRQWLHDAFSRIPHNIPFDPAGQPWKSQRFECENSFDDQAVLNLIQRRHKSDIVLLLLHVDYKCSRVATIRYKVNFIHCSVF